VLTADQARRSFDLFAAKTMPEFIKGSGGAVLLYRLIAFLIPVTGRAAKTRATPMPRTGTICRHRQSSVAKRDQNSPNMPAIAESGHRP
jgi:hypothetical protein